MSATEKNTVESGTPAMAIPFFTSVEIAITGIRPGEKPPGQRAKKPGMNRSNTSMQIFYAVFKLKNTPGSHFKKNQDHHKHYAYLNPYIRLI